VWIDISRREWKKIFRLLERSFGKSANQNQKAGLLYRQAGPSGTLFPSTVHAAGCFAVLSRRHTGFFLEQADK
jgi:hypothetical protein